MKKDINISSIKIINTENTGPITSDREIANRFIHQLELKKEDGCLDPLATKYAVYIATQESRIHHIFDAINEKIIPHQYAVYEIDEANQEIGSAWQNVLSDTDSKPNIIIDINTALTTLREYGSVVASQETFTILYQWAENQMLSSE